MRNLSLSVLQLNNYIKRIIDSEELLIGIGLFGEVSNFKISNGNAYFDLKEEGASISCMMFGEDVVCLENGKQVELFGRLSFYPKFGKLTFIAKTAQELGKGALYQKYLELKEKLEKEGLFDAKTKKQIPSFANKIGLVTSETGAVVHDILTVARKKNPKTSFIIYPVKVQGDGAELSIANGVDYFSESDVDVVIVARGGGSFEDLAPFNTELVARRIFACKKPIISAVGHETDFSISDFAADLRCATPSVASETAVFDWYFVCEQLKLNANDITKSVLNVFEEQKENLKLLAGDVSDFAILSIQNSFDKLRNVSQKIGLSTNVEQSKTEFDLLSLRLEKSNPLSLLKNGYLVAERQGKSVQHLSEIEVGDEIEINFFDGIAKAKILSKEKKNGTNI